MNEKEFFNVSKKEAFSYAATMILSAVITFVVLFYVAQPVIVQGDSMNPTLKNGNMLIIQKITKEYERFDIITVTVGGTHIIKRVIGTPGDTVQIVDGKLFINNKELNDVVNIKIDDPGIAENPITLSENEYFVMGDNRNNSLDSRSEQTGTVNSNQIFGKVLFRLFPFNIF